MDQWVMGQMGQHEWVSRIHDPSTGDKVSQSNFKNSLGIRPIKHGTFRCNKFGDVQLSVTTYLGCW